MIILDASAFLAYAQNESGAVAVQAASAQDQLAMSAVNHSEVVQKLALRNISVAIVENVMDELGVAIVPFTHKLSVQTASLFRARSGLSLADRACLATAVELQGTAFTADRAWAKFEFGVSVTVIR